MPSGEWSAASARVKPATAALVVSYCRLPPPATTERTEATLTMAPPLLRRISGTAALGTEDVAHQVDVEDLVPARRTRLVDLLVFADAGIVDEDVEAPELLRGTVDEGEACGLGTNVSLREGDLGAGGLELGRHALAALAVPIAECHARALGEKTPDRRLADPRCPARHRCDLAVEPSHVRHLSLHCETRIHDTSYPSGGHRHRGRYH